MLCKQFADSMGKAPVLFNKMRHLLAGLFPAFLTGCCGNKPNLVHLGCPLFVMVSLSRRLPIVMLPQVYHFMCKGRQYLMRFPGGKVGWIKSKLIGYFFWIRSLCKAFA